MSKQYVALFTGNGEGCDYTIGCNKTWKMITASSKKEAEAKAIDVYWEHGGEAGEPGVASIELLEISSSIKIDVDTIEKEHRKTLNQIIESQTEKKEREELVRLQKKYGSQVPQ